MPRRIAGVLLHPTSLPGAGAAADPGPGATSFLDWLQRAGATVWQILPLGPPGHAGSPYDSGSSFAGNTALISIRDLVEDGLLTEGEVEAGQAEDLGAARRRLLDRALSGLKSGRQLSMQRELEEFRSAPETAAWLEDWALYASLKDHFGGRPWNRWPDEVRHREPRALEAAARRLRDRIEFERFAQFLFFRQWSRLRRRAARRGIELLGDLPFYVSLDSADVWCRPDLFDLEPDGSPRSVAGVPPDYFSAVGQRWGNPIYRWDRLRGEDFDWWMGRLEAQLRLVDRVRIDHFRAFSAYWRIPAAETTAVAGAWEQGPGEAFFAAAKRRFGDLPLVAEDLGEIDDSVRELRRGVGLPGMRVLQFGFDAPDSEHLPRNYPEDCLAYTGTHDNDTAVGWFASLEAPVRSRVLEYLGGDGDDIHWRMIGAVMSSVAREAFVPMQDVLGLDGSCRMNRPGTETGNWRWRLRPDQLSVAAADRLRALVEAGRRLREGPSLG